MKDRIPSNAGDAEARRSQGVRRAGGPSRQKGFVERATAQGHSGHGAESVRPHLRDQLRLKALLPTPYPMPEAQPSKEEQR